ncbi:DUF3124 domain-containing protein [Aliifodinibius sp. S!AR15-10]|uniref:DUF3124 domain-containing protein n=1 Tax=Aliifodinibius sp. S!AR15-10 TaxID=2950437 RepID=UPI00285A952A|nr:DUF3124 domain-containing protein [Aliifodinibius sp. S!AR15-10]MDR8391232.1 DUF3124 domain-containing protein [Aliifodinibius sp. S!AR15-10]
MTRFLFFSLPSLFFLLIVAGCQTENRQESPSGKGSAVAPSDSTTALTAASFVNFSENAIMGENVYVPVYSHIYQLDHRKTFNLTATLSFRNSDMQHPITLKKVYYYDSKGSLVHKYLDQPQTIGPLASTSFVVEEEDLRGGVGANFLVLWESEEQVSHPIIEAVMISTSQQQGISFVSEGRAIHSLGQNVKE